MTRARWARCPLCRGTFDASTVVPPAGVRLVSADAAIGPPCADCLEILGLVAIGLGEDVVLAVSGPLPVGDLLPAAADDPHTAAHARGDMLLSSCSLCTARGGVR